MKAVVLKKKEEIAVEDIEIPRLSEPKKKVKIEACGVCGSDLRYYKGDNPWAIQTLGFNMDNPNDIVIGHEAGGVVEENGEEQLVFPWTFKGCMECEMCLTGKEQLCPDTQHIGHGAGWGEMDHYPGTMAEYCEIWSDRVYPVSDDLKPEEVAMIEPTSVAVHALETSGLKAGSSVAIIGMGSIGLLIAQVARKYGASTIVGTDPRRLPLEKAEELGVDRPVRIGEESVKEVVENTLDSDGVDYVFDTVGTPETIEEGLSLLRPGGRLTQLAGPLEEISFPYTHLSAEKSIKTSANFNYFDMKTAIDFVERGEVRTKPLITHRFDISDAKRAFEVALNKEEHKALKVMVLP